MQHSKVVQSYTKESNENTGNLVSSTNIKDSEVGILSQNEAEVTQVKGENINLQKSEACEELFVCNTCNELKKRSMFLKQNAKKPGMCRECAGKRKQGIIKCNEVNNETAEKKDKERVTVFLSEKSQIILKTVADDIERIPQSLVVEKLLEDFFEKSDEKIKNLVYLKLSLVRKG